MKVAYLFSWMTGLAAILACGALPAASQTTILTPPASARPRINGPSVFGVRPGSPFLYSIPASGERPMEFNVEGLPEGLAVDAATGRMHGVLKDAGVHKLVLRAKNARGSAQKAFRIVVGEQICLTPPLGWNSWNCWADAVDQDKVLRSARAMVKSGLIDHGWTYVNIDDTWQGRRGGPLNGLQANEKFSDMKGLCDEIHAMGLKPGIYSTPWITSYAKYAGGSSDNPNGAWSEKEASDKFWRHGKYSFAANDARQWAAWGFDYLKYDWYPNDVRARGGDEQGTARARDATSSIACRIPPPSPRRRIGLDWPTAGGPRAISGTTGTIATPTGTTASRRSASRRTAGRPLPDRATGTTRTCSWWATWAGARNCTRTKLTPDEQYTHISMWCLLSAPLLIGCDMDRLDPFTLNLLTNDEVLALDQDALGKQAKRVATLGALDVFLKELEDGSKAVGFFNRGDKQRTFVFNKLSRIGIDGKQRVRDLWRQKDLPDATGQVEVDVRPHGVVLLKFTPAEAK